MASSRKNKVIIAITLVLLLVIMAPFAYFFLDAAIDTGEPFFTCFFIVLIVAYILAAAMVIYVWGGKNEGQADSSSKTEGNGPSPTEILTAVTLGAALGGRSSRKKRKSLSESARDELFWQEKYHKDRHSDEGEDL